MTRNTKLLLLAAALGVAAVVVVVMRGLDAWILWSGYGVGLPSVLIPPLVVIWVARRIDARRRRGRIARGLCPACSYDVRATPGRCPECGEALPARCPECGQTVDGRIEARLTGAG
jgi:hypothetical protein